MTKSIPTSPSIKHLRNEAKNIVRAHKECNPSCCTVLRNLYQFKAYKDADILKAKASLQDAQLALALEYGFKNWSELKQHVEREEGKTTNATVLRKLAWVPRATSHIGCLEACANYLNLGLSPARIAGGTGQAFFMNMDKHLCPSSPHCWDYFTTTPRLAKNLGLDIQVEMALPWNEDEDFHAKQAEVWNFVKNSIDHDYPCYGWHYEFIVIGGYDEKGYLLSGPVAAPRTHPLGYHAFDSWKDFGATAGPESVEIASVRPCKKADETIIMKDAFTFAVQAAQTHGLGLGAYDSWIEGLTALQTEDGFGMAYNSAVYYECRRFARAFLDESRQQTGKRCADLLTAAAKYYQDVEAALKTIVGLFPLDENNKSMMHANLASAERREQAAAALLKAKNAEAEGIAILEHIVNEDTIFDS